MAPRDGAPPITRQPGAPRFAPMACRSHCGLKCELFLTRDGNVGAPLTNRRWKAESPEQQDSHFNNKMELSFLSPQGIGSPQQCGGKRKMLMDRFPSHQRAELG